MKIRNSIECWIYNKVQGRFLLLQCPETQKHPSYWQPVTGGLLTNEAQETACIREVEEETGILFGENDLIRVVDRFTIPVPQEDFLLVKPVFAVETTEYRVAISDEHVAHRWTKPDEVSALLHWDSNRHTFKLVNRHLGLSS